MDDLDSARCKQEYFDACLEDLKGMPDWNGTNYPIWREQTGIYRAKLPHAFYEDTLQKLIKTGLIYPCNRTRKEIRKAGIKSHSGEQNIISRKVESPQ